MSAKAVYDFETIVESALKTLLTDQQFTAFTSLEVPDFQKDRPRVEIVFLRGAGQLRWASRAALPVALQSRKIESAWKAALHFKIVTATDAGGKSLLTDYRSRLRQIIANLEQEANETYLPHHVIKLPRDMGDAREINPEQGFETLTITTEIDFSINANAWALLNQPDA